MRDEVRCSKSLKRKGTYDNLIRRSSEEHRIAHSFLPGTSFSFLLTEQFRQFWKEIFHQHLVQGTLFLVSGVIKLCG